METEVQSIRSFIPAYFLKAYKECGSRSDIVHGVSPLPVDAISTYYIPNATDYAVIKQIVSDSEVAIQTLQAEMRKIQSQISNLQRSYELHRSALSPIRRVTDDILGQIFTHVLLREDIDVNRQNADIWTFSKVCMRWKAVIRATPRLWSNLTITGFSDIAEQAIKWRIDTCLKLSKAVPLSISLSSNMNQRQIHGAVETLEYILSHENLLEMLSFNAMTAQRILSQNAVATRFTQLRVLNVRGGVYKVYPFELLCNAKQLEEVTMQSIALSGAAIAHWRNLKRLTLSMMHGTLNELIALLKECPLLEELSLLMLNLARAGAEQASNKMMMLPALRTLRFGCIRQDILDRLCPLLHVPNIINLEVDSNDIIDGILDMIQRSRSSIMRLHLNTHSWMRFIGDLPKIQELVLTGSWTREGEFTDVLSRLVWSFANASQNILPNLQILELQILFPASSDSYPIIHKRFLPDIMRSRSHDLINSYNVGVHDSFPHLLTFIRYLSTFPENIKDVEKITELGKELQMTVEKFYLHRGIRELEY